jgi:hypothetical protein
MLFEHWQAANRKRAHLFTFDLSGYYRLGRRRIAKAKATRAEMMAVLGLTGCECVLA